MTRRRRLTSLLTAVVVGLSVLTACSRDVDGFGTIGPVDLTVVGDSGNEFDAQVKDALTDVIGFWELNYPKISGGEALPQLQGKLYSIDGDAVIRTKSAPEDAKGNACLQKRLTFIIDNAAFCRLDDSIVWDRGLGHLVPVLTADYGPALTALIFAHEFGHAIQHRLGVEKQDVRVIDIESQADCAAGAFAAAALDGRSAHFPMSAEELDKALDGYFQVRDSTPDTSEDVTHGNGFDRLNALQQGIEHGPTYCFSNSYIANLEYTERGYVNPADYGQGGNEPIADLLSAKGIATDLNRFWKSAGESIKKTFQPVKLAQADHPKCGTADPTSEFGYCPDDNTVYYSTGFAQRAYNSITAPQIDKQTAQVSVAKNLPADYALGELIAIAWGMAARHQFFGKSVTDTDALKAAVCYSGAYAEDINISDYDDTHQYILSPPDMDEATFAVLNLVGQDSAFSARDTSGLERVQSFVTGYGKGLSGC